MKEKKLEKGVETVLHNFLKGVMGFVPKEDLLLIAKDRCGCSFATADRKLRSLEEKGYIMSEKRGSKGFSWYKKKIVEKVVEVKKEEVKQLQLC